MVVLNQVIDFATVRGVGTLSLTALSTGDDEVRHAESKGCKGLTGRRSWGRDEQVFIREGRSPAL
jgi:hypothetical protein